jgi:hypothetical protein
VIFWKIILTGEYSILTYPDSSFQSYPWSQYIAVALHQHQFPFWDPYCEAGRPFIGEPSTGVFYPFNLLLGLFPLNSKGLLPVAIIEYMVVLHCFLASLLTYLLGRHLGLSRFSAFIAGLVFAYSGSVGIRSFAQISIFDASVWVPAVFLFYSKSLRSLRLREQVLFAGLGGLFLALCVLAGHHQPFVYTSMALVIAGLAIAFFRGVSLYESTCRQPSRLTILRATVLLFAFALALSSLQLFPTLQYSHYVYRWVGGPQPIQASASVSYHFAATHWTFPPQGLLLTIFPHMSDVENSPYFGILPLLFAGLSLAGLRRSRVIRLFWLLAVFFLALSLADYTPLHGILYFLLPYYSKAREAVRSLLLVHFSLSLLAGFGCQIFLSPFPKRTRLFKLRVIQAFAAAALFFTFLVVASYYYRTEVLFQPTNYDGLFFSCLLLLVSSGVALARFYGGAGSKALKVAAVVICLLDYHVFLSRHIRPKAEFDRKANFEPKQFYHQDNVVAFLRSQPGVYRTDFQDHAYPRNIGDVAKLETIDGYEATGLREFHDLLSQEPSVGGPISKLLNVRYIVSAKELPLPKVFEEKSTRIYENAGYLPRAWTVPRVSVLPDASHVRAALAQSSFDPRAEALMEGSLPEELHSLSISKPSTPVSEMGSVQFERRGPNRFIVDVQTASPGFLVVSENWYPGWAAKVNGKPCAARRVDGTLMGVYVGSGHSRVEFSFLPEHFYWQLSLTMLALLVLMYVAIQQLGPKGEKQSRPISETKLAGI